MATHTYTIPANVPVFTKPPIGKIIVKEHVREDCPLRGISEKGHPAVFKKLKGKCECPKYAHVKGTVHGEGWARIPLGCDSWSEADIQFAFLMNELHPITRADRAKAAETDILDIEIEYAMSECIKKAKSRTKKSKLQTLLNQMKPFLVKHNDKHPDRKLKFVKHLVIDVLDNFTDTWTGYSVGEDESGKKVEGIATGTVENKIGALIYFFTFCISRKWYPASSEWIEKRGRLYKDNPARHIEKFGVYTEQTHNPLSDRLEEAVFGACLRYSEGSNGRNLKQEEGIDLIMNFLSRLMSESGLSATDAYTCEMAKLDKHNMLEVRRIKTKKKGGKGIPVCVRITDELADELRRFGKGKKHFFWDGEGVRSDAIRNFDLYEKYARIWKLVPDELKKDLVGKFQPHCFRNTLARRLFQQGASVEQVARILGNTPAIVRKHYWKMCPEVQDELTSLVMSTWKVNRKKGADVIQPISPKVVHQPQASA